MTREIECRQALPSDARGLASLRYRWRVEERDERGMSEAEFVGAFTRWTAARSASHQPFIAVAGDEPVGMAWLALVERIPGPARWTRLSGIVQSVYVIPERRDDGIGARLMNAVISRARELSLEWLIVHPSRRAVPFYRRLGFTGTTKMLRLEL